MPRITLGSFRRITKSGTFIPEIDGLRFIAIVSVIFLHCYGELLNRMSMGTALGLNSSKPGIANVNDDQHGLLRLVAHGGYGVEVFFAVSGFVLAWPFAKWHLRGEKAVKLSAYFIRRLTRLEPPYILALLLRTLLLLAMGLQPVHFLLVHLFASIFYVHNIAFGIASRIEAVSWTLEIEVQFYCLAPLLGMIYRISAAWQRRTLLILFIAAATPLQRAFLPGWSGPLNAGAFMLSILAYIQFFLVGLLVADVYVDGWERITSGWIWDVVLIPLWFLYFWLPVRTFLFLSPLMLPILFIGAFKGKALSAFFRKPVITAIGGMCYSIYLTHRTTILVCDMLLVRFHLGFPLWLAFSLLVVAPASIVVGAVYFLLIERPCMDPLWPQKFVARLRTRRWSESLSARRS